MSIKPGTYVLGPENGALSIHTGKHGAAAMAGHNLHIEVTSWNATIALADDPAQTSVQLTADSRSLRVVDGTGGAKHLGTDDKANIAKTINKEVLKGTEIAFRSTSVHGGDGGLHVHGELDLSGKTQPIEFVLVVADDGHLTGSATVVQSTWGMKPYHARFGTLKVNDDVEVRIDATLPVPAAG
jgi:polyisoprenoid-binding protein YceI